MVTLGLFLLIAGLGAFQMWDYRIFHEISRPAAIAVTACAIGSYFCPRRWWLWPVALLIGYAVMFLSLGSKEGNLELAAIPYMLFAIYGLLALAVCGLLGSGVGFVLSQPTGSWRLIGVAMFIGLGVATLVSEIRWRPPSQATPSAEEIRQAHWEEEYSKALVAYELGVADGPAHMHRLASGEDVPVEVLRRVYQLARHGRNDLSERLAANPATPQDVIVGLVRHPDPRVHGPAVSNPAMPREVLHALAKTGDSVLAGLAQQELDRRK